MQLSTLHKQSFKGFTLIELLVVIAIIGLLSTIVAAPVQSARKKAKDTKKIAEIKQMQTALANFANDNGMFASASTTFGTQISGLTPTYIPALPTSMGVTSNVAARDRLYYVSFFAIPPGTTQGKIFGYHMASTLEVYNTVLQDDSDCWGAVSSSSQNIAAQRNGGPCIAFTSAEANNPSFPNAAANIGASTTPVTGNASKQYTVGSATITAADAAGHASTTFTFDAFAGTGFTVHPRLASAREDIEGAGVNESASSTCATIDLCLYDVAESY